MNKILSIVTFFVLMMVPLFSTTINIPADFPTIQEGIHASADGDTVLVSDGIYYENLSINREITLASHFIIDGDISHRDATIIDGSNYDEDSGPFGSCVLFRPSENGDAISPKLTGFTIQNGQGTRVRETIEGAVITYYMGGGLMIWHALPEITYNYIRNNGGETETRAGRSRRGGGSGLNNRDDVEFDEDRSEPRDRPFLTRDDEIIFSNNIFENNNSETGNTFESIGYGGDIDFSGSFFDVFASEYEDVSEYWVTVDSAGVDFSGGSGGSEAITQDVYVSPEGSDENDCLTADTQLKHIDFALSQIYPNSSNIITINISGGTISPSTTGENFPIIILSNINLIGQGEEVTIIDAEETYMVIIVDDFMNNIFSDLTIVGGTGDVGGMYISFSNPTLTNLTISGNSGTDAGGIYMYSSNPTLIDIAISENTATNLTGGMYI